jgi:hypothetical protein
MNALWDWKIIMLIAGTMDPVPQHKGMDLPSKIACIRAEAQIQTNASHVNAVCVKKSTKEVFDFYPNPG